MMDLLRVSMTDGQINREEFPKNLILGGRGVIDYLLTKHADPRVHPLSKRSYFVVAPGLLAGTNAPNSGRLSIGGKSPLTGTIKEANVGGTSAHKLARLGIRAIMVSGLSESLKILKIDDTGAVLEDASTLKGLGNYRACEILCERYGGHIGIIIAGPAGEMKLSNSTVAVTDPEGRPSRHAARGGMGSVMAAKGLKAIVIDDANGKGREPVDKEGFKVAVKSAAEMITSKPICQNLAKFGTGLWVDSDHVRGSMPTYNYREGAFEKHERINGKRISELAEQRKGKMGHRCMPTCVVRCSTVYNDTEGKYVTSGLEYETLAMLGANLGIDDLDAIAMMDHRCDDLGIDTIEMGAAIGVLNDVGLFEFGNKAEAITYLDEVAKGSPIGRILGNGVSLTAKAFGIARVPAVKGQAIPAHTARTVKGWGVTYATSPQGADHTAGPVGVEPLSPEGQVERSRLAQIQMASLDATGMCFFTFTFATPGAIIPMINSLYGIHWSENDYLDMGKEMLRQEIAFNRKAGIAVEGNSVPDWLREEPLPPQGTVFDVPQDELDRIFDF
jgi:aldehyde:ferredoxin oxidoreductase